MKFFLVLLIVCVAANAYKVDKITGVEGTVYQIEFDRYSHTYLAVQNNETFLLYVLEERNNSIIFKTEIPKFGYLLRGDIGNIYILSKSDKSLRSILVLNTKSLELKFLLYYGAPSGSCSDDWNFSDRDGNLYVNHADGVAILKPRQHFLTAITNLDGFIFCVHEEDNEGNVYFARYYFGTYEIFVVTNGAKNELVPYAQVVPGLGNSAETRLTRGFGNVLAISNGRRLEVRKLDKTSSKLIYSRYRGNYQGWFTSKDKFYMIGGDEFNTQRFIYIFQSNGFLYQSENDIDMSFGIIAPIPEWGNIAYYAFGKKTEDEKTTWKILSMGYRDYKIKYLNFTFTDKIEHVTQDPSNNLWVLANGLFVYIPETEEVIQVSDLPLRAPGQVFPLLKFKLPYVYVGAQDGLYVCFDERYQE